MALYEYKGITLSGTKVKGKIYADTQSEAEGKLPKLKEITYFQINPFDIELPSALRKLIPVQKIKKAAIAEFLEQISFLNSAGLSLVESISIIIGCSDKSLTAIAIIVSRDIEAGHSLSQSFALHPDIFPESMSTQVEAGEKTGNVPIILMNVSKQIKSQNKAAGKIKNAMTYPAVVAVITLAIAWAMMVFVVPQITQMFEDLTDATLPLITRVTIAVSNFMSTYAIPLFIAMIFSVAFFVWAIKHNLKLWWDSLLLKIPIVRNVVISNDVMSFFRILAFSVSSGITQLEGINIAVGSVGNLKFRAELKESERLVNDDAIDLATALNNSSILTGLQIQAISIGVQSGKLDEVLFNMANDIEDNLNDLIARMTAMIEPLMILSVASVVGTIMISVYIPLIGIATNI